MGRRADGTVTPGYVARPGYPHLHPHLHRTLNNPHCTCAHISPTIAPASHPHRTTASYLHRDRTPNQAILSDTRLSRYSFFAYFSTHIHDSG